MYRNPLDIVVSEAFYYHQDGKTAFCGYLSELSLEKRILRLIDDPWLLGSIRDRIGNFIAWLDFPNVIPISYEELVGEKGNGDDTILKKLIWSLQIKLHVPGEPTKIAEKIYNEKSPTYRKGRIGAHREHFSPEAYACFSKLPQDFMEILGYDLNHTVSDFILPRRAEEFRRRPIKLGHEHHNSIPIAVESNFLGYDIIVYKTLYYAVPRSIPMVDFGNATNEELEKLSSAGDLTSIKKKILQQLKKENNSDMNKNPQWWSKVRVLPISILRRLKDKSAQGS